MPKTSPKAWRCPVCGYVHREADPPDWCPVCGADGSDFERYLDKPAPAKADAAQWRCLNCGHVHDGAEAPKACSVCGAPSDRFEPFADSGPVLRPSSAPTKVVVVGAGIAGISAVESLRRCAPDVPIVLISKETSLPYYRLNLTRYLAGEIGRELLPIHPEDWYRENRVELLRGAEVSALLPDQGAVELSDRGRVDFERLVLTVGAHPFVPPLPGAHREGVMTLRTVEDADRMVDTCRPGMSCVCIGGGILGLETAGALARRGLSTTLLEGCGWLMPRQLPPRAGRLLQQRIAEMGIEVRTGVSVEEIVGDERAAGVRVGQGEVLPADLVVIATGVRPNSHLARRAGLEVGAGVVVDHLLFSSHPRILAAGDVAEHRGTLYGTWSAAQYQGNIAGRNAAGLGVEFGGIPRSNTLKVLGIDLLSIGRFEPEDASFDVVEQEADGSYYRFVFHDGRIVGAVLLGDTSASAALKRAVESGADLSGLLAGRPAALEVARHLAST